MNSTDPSGTEEKTSGDDADPLIDPQHDCVDIFYPKLVFKPFIWPQDKLDILWLFCSSKVC